MPKLVAEIESQNRSLPPVQTIHMFRPWISSRLSGSAAVHVVKVIFVGCGERLGRSMRAHRFVEDVARLALIRAPCGDSAGRNAYDDAHRAENCR